MVPRARGQGGTRRRDTIFIDMSRSPSDPSAPPPEPQRVGATAPFPREEVLGLLRRLPAYARLALALSRDDRIPAPRRAALMGAAAYLVSPIDVLPGIIPIVGQLDDLLLIIVALRVALSSLSEVQRLEVLAHAGLSEGDLGEDLATLGAVGEWLVVRGLRAGRAIARAGAVAAVAVTKSGIWLGRGAVGHIERRRRARRS
jgi:uncharacterized membrane protein YkvA (DUF1232 family)